MTKEKKVLEIKGWGDLVIVEMAEQTDGSAEDLLAFATKKYEEELGA